MKPSSWTLATKTPSWFGNSLRTGIWGPFWAEWKDVKWCHFDQLPSRCSRRWLETNITYFDTTYHNSCLAALREVVQGLLGHASQLLDVVPGWTNSDSIQRWYNYRTRLDLFLDITWSPKTYHSRSSSIAYSKMPIEQRVRNYENCWGTGSCMSTTVPLQSVVHFGSMAANPPAGLYRRFFTFRTFSQRGMGASCGYCVMTCYTAKQDRTPPQTPRWDGSRPGHVQASESLGAKLPERQNGEGMRCPRWRENSDIENRELLLPVWFFMAPLMELVFWVKKCRVRGQTRPKTNHWKLSLRALRV